MKKLYLLVAILLLISTTAMAADNPIYLYGYLPSNSESPVDGKGSITIPNEIASYPYSFDSRTIHYSDFDISPTDTDTDLVIYYKSTSPAHSLKLEVRKVPNEVGKKGELIYSTELNVTRNRQRIVVNASKLSRNLGYYISLSEPLIDGDTPAAGEITVAGSRGRGNEVTISRRDFSVEIAALIKSDSVGPAEGFVDVSDSTQSYEAIMMLQSLGIVKGVGGGLFSPRDEITYGQAFTMAARLFMTDEEIEAIAPYPVGGAAVCSRLGLTKGISAELSNGLTLVDCEILLQNIAEKLDIQVDWDGENILTAGQDQTDVITYEGVENIPQDVKYRLTQDTDIQEAP